MEKKEQVNLTNLTIKKTEVKEIIGDKGDKKRKKICDLVESYITNVQIDDIENFYGVGTTIKIMDMYYSTTKKSLIIDCKIKLGETINEDILDTTVLELVLSNTMDVIYPKFKLGITVSWDS